jgi:hypothetical protein
MPSINLSKKQWQIALALLVVTIVVVSYSYINPSTANVMEKWYVANEQNSYNLFDVSSGYTSTTACQSYCQGMQTQMCSVTFVPSVCCCVMTSNPPTGKQLSVIGCDGSRISVKTINADGSQGQVMVQCQQGTVCDPSAIGKTFTFQADSTPTYRPLCK